jgi:diguanylate cyclase (GGDEF)-like protein
MTVRRWIARPFWALTLAWTVAYVAYLGFGLGRGTLDTFFQVYVQDGLLAAGALACLARGVLVERERTPWLLLGLGLTSWAGANVVFSALYPNGDSAPAVSIADALWLAFYPASWLALILLVRSRVSDFRMSIALDGLIGALLLGSACAALLIDPIVHAAGTSTETILVNLAYPLGDAVILAFVLAVFLLTGWRPGRSWLLLVAGFAVNSLGDSYYVHQVAVGAWQDATILDAVFVVAVLLMAAAAWQTDRERPPVRLEGFALVATPLIFALAAIAMLSWGVAHPLKPLAGYLAVGALGLVLVRCALTFGENLRLADSHHRSRTDDLTGLPNRRHLLAALEERLATEGAADEPFSLVMLDVDGFKEVNDTLGHDAGDAVLGQIGPRLAARLPTGALLARLGGDEYAVVVDGDEHAGVAATRVLQTALETPFTVDGLDVHVDASMGVAVFPEHAETARALLQRADIAMYQAKTAHTGWAVYDGSRDGHSRERLELLGDLRGAMERGEIVVFFQPQVSLPEGKPVGVEALVRWQHPERGMLPPGIFLALVEHAGLMGQLTLHVLEQSLHQCAAWRDAGVDLRVAVNLAAPNLADPHLPDDVAVLLRKAGVPAHRLKLEITETIVMADPVHARTVLDGLCELGVSLALDDFGTGHSSLSYLKEMPVSELKLDRSFVSGIVGDERDAAIVEATVSLARTLGLRVVGEGVEDAETVTLLCELGCDEAQGYYFSKPVPADELAAWLRGDQPLADAA